MRLRHFETLRPSCPICRRDTNEIRQLSLSLVLKQKAEVIFEGLLLCSNPACQREYPIIDGIPLIIANLRGFLGENYYQLMARDDLSEPLESLIGDCAGPGSLFDVTRHQLGSYARDHYGMLDPEEPDTDPRPGEALRVLQAGMTQLRTLPAGPVLDLGCSVGGTTLALAERTDRLVLGVDLNLSMLRLASSAIYRGFVQYPKKRTGVVYDRRRIEVNSACAENVDFWACDAAALPFANDTFALAVALNLIDCVRSPRDMLVELTRVLAPNAQAILTSPYDWSAAATPIEAWLGGHSQRSPNRGASEPVLRALLTPGGHPVSIGGLELESELPEVPWHVRLHDRSTVSYRVHLVVARKSPPNAPSQEPINLS